MTAVRTRTSCVRQPVHHACIRGAAAPLIPPVQVARLHAHGACGCLPRVGGRCSWLKTKNGYHVSRGNSPLVPTGGIL